MRNKIVVLDASALLALLSQEPGYQIVENSLSNAIISSVNLSEVLAVLYRKGMESEEAKLLMSYLIKEILPFTLEQACMAASLIKITEPYGLSFGDRACLALARIHNSPVLTADRDLEKIKTGVKIQLIR